MYAHLIPTELLTLDCHIDANNLLQTIFRMQNFTAIFGKNIRQKTLFKWLAKGHELDSTSPGQELLNPLTPRRTRVSP